MLSKFTVMDPTAFAHENLPCSVRTSDAGRTPVPEAHSFDYEIVEVLIDGLARPRLKCPLLGHESCIVAHLASLVSMVMGGSLSSTTIDDDLYPCSSSTVYFRPSCLNVVT